MHMQKCSEKHSSERIKRRWTFSRTIPLKTRRRDELAYTLQGILFASYYTAIPESGPNLPNDLMNS